MIRPCLELNPNVGDASSVLLADKKSQWNQHQRLYHQLQHILPFRSTKLSSTNLTSATLKHPHTFFQDSEALVAESHHPIPSAVMTLKAHQLVRTDSLSYPSISCSLLKVFGCNGFHDLATVRVNHMTGKPWTGIDGNYMLMDEIR